MKHEHDIPRQPWHDRLLHEHVHDPYKTRLKLPEPSVCPQCGAVFHDGRWHWAPRPEEAHEEFCQACHRINDRYPAGEVWLLAIPFAIAMLAAEEGRKWLVRRGAHPSAPRALAPSDLPAE